ncbi:non-homologous end-joining DNA ligase [Phenylobacterium sp. LjRoot219]|uniref:non-homologous end-joining DNA ligase n=1 Tax=Phenylobacterium sp. LjRoot219 TaxID=3342283 RepID=UPI003ECF4AD4
MARRPSSQRQYVRQPMPGFLEFQHAQLVREPPSGEAWIHEIKFDGYRLQARIEAGAVTLFTRRGFHWTQKLPRLAAELSACPDCILDGELCFIGADGQPTFSGLRAAIGRGDTDKLVFFAFDILWRAQDDLRRFPLKDRKEVLDDAIAPALGETVRAVDSFPLGGPTLLASACRLGLEGIVSKRRDSLYRAGRSDAWVKSKCRLAQEFVIGGWVQEAGRHFKGILVGVQGPKGLTYVGSLERGFSAEPGLLKRLEPLKTKMNPFKTGDPPRAHVHWVEPILVAQAEFQEWTASGKIRHASFKGLRDDKDPGEVRRERPEAEPL